MQRHEYTNREKEEGELYRLLAENVKDYAIFVVDSEGRVQSWNPGAERLLGYREDEILGQSAEIFFTPEDIQAKIPQQEIQEALTGGRGNDDRWHVRKDGSRFWSGGMMTPLWEEGGTLRGFAKIMRDRTEWKRQIEQVRLQNILLDSVGQAVIATTPDGTIFYWNQYAEMLYGWPRAEALGHNVIEVTVPRSQTASAESIMGKLARGENWSGEFLVQRRDGAEFPVQVTNTPILDGQGKITAIVGVSSNISERKQAESLLRHSEERFRSLMEQAPFSIQVFSPDGRTIRVNRAWEDLWGVRFEQIGGYNILEDRQLEAKGVLDYVRQGFAGNTARIPAIEYNPNETIPDVTAEADPRRWLSAVIYPIKDADGNVQEVVLIHEDITVRKRAEEELQRSERQSRTILESITEAFCALDQDWRFTYLNPQAEVLLGQSRGDVIGKILWEVYPDLLGTEVEHRYRQALAENVTAIFENYYPPHDRWYEIHAYPSLEGLSIYFRDVSERKQAEEALRESEKRFRQLADAMPQIVWTARPDGNIDYLNRRWVEFTGLPETSGNDAWGHILHPDDSQPAHERWAASLQSGEPFNMEIRLFDRAEQAYRWHLIRTVAVYDKAGKVVRWFGTSTDIHEQKRAEESSRYLAEASATLAQVIDYESTLEKVANLAVPYFADWSAVDVASEGSLRRLGVAHKDPEKIRLAHELLEHYPPEPEAKAGIGAVFRTGTPQIVGELTDDMLVRGSKDERHLRLMRSLGLKSYICVPLIVTGKPFGVLTFATAESGRRYTQADLALAQDLAHRAAVAIENTQLYQTLRENDRRKDEFLATLAHELRNPLAPIHNSLQVLKMGRVDDETSQQIREMMERQVDHLVRLVDDLMDISRVMRGKIELRREKVELASVVARALETAKPLIDVQGHRLEISMPPESLLLDADPVRLAQVIGNLLTNAAKYTEADGKIWVKAEREGGEAVLRVKDNGIGIAPEMLAHIFELFVQVDHTSSKSQGGLGIGLTLVKNLVEMHGGTITANSQGLGQGCEFVVRWPLVVQDAQKPMSHGDSPERQETASSGFRLLVVDDNKDAAKSLAMLLRLHGHEIQVAYNGPSALELATTYSPDLVFLDIGMPKMDGYEVARRLRQTPGLENVILVALTGWGQEEDRRRTAEAGFDHHLVKPPEPKFLEKVLADLKQTRH